MKKYTNLSWKYLKEQRKRTILTVVGIILSVMLIGAVGIIGESIQNGMVNQVIEMGGRYHAQLKKLDSKQIRILKNHVQIESVGLQVPLAGYHSEENGVRISIEGWDQQALEIMQFSIAEGRFPSGKNEIALEYWVLEQLGVQPELGKKIPLQYKNSILLQDDQWENFVGDNEFTLVGVLNNHPGTKMTKQGLGLISIETAKRLRGNYPIDEHAFIWIKEGFPVQQTANKIIEYLNKEYEDVHLNDNLLRVASESYQVYLPIIFIGVIVILATVIVIYNIFHISLMERIKEFGVLRSIGITPNQLKRILFQEAFILSVIGIPCGILLGMGVSQIIVGNLSILNDVANEVVISLRVVTLSAVVGVISVYISVFNPARLAGKISPMEAIRNNSQVIKESKFKNKPLANLIESIFGVTGKLAYKNLWRNKKRSVVTILSISISCILFIIFSFINQSADFNNIFDKFIHGDYSLQTTRAYQSGDYYTEQDFADLCNLIGVQEVREVQYRGFGGGLFVKEENLPEDLKKNSRYLGEPNNQGDYYLGCDFFGLNTQTLFESEKYLQIGEIDLVQMSEKPIALLTERSMPDGLKVGDHIKVVLRKWNGDKLVIEKEMEFEIGGILHTYPISMGEYSMGPGLIIHKNIFQMLFGTQGYARFDVIVSPDADREYIKKNLQAISKHAKLGTLIDYDEEKAEIQKMKRQLQVLVLCIVAIIAVIGVLNIINTISTNLIIRTKEFGMLRAIGTTSQQLKKMIQLEGMFYGLFSALWAIPIGTVLSYCLYQLFRQEATYMEWGIPYISIIGISVGTLLIGVLATVIPVRRIAKMDIVEAVRNVE